MHWDDRNLYSISIAARTNYFNEWIFRFQWVEFKAFLRRMSSSRSITFSTRMPTWTKALSLYCCSIPTQGNSSVSWRVFQMDLCLGFEFWRIVDGSIWFGSHVSFGCVWFYLVVIDFVIPNSMLCGFDNEFIVVFYIVSPFLWLMLTELRLVFFF